MQVLNTYFFFVVSVFSSSLSFKCAVRESGCRIGYEQTKMSQDHFFLVSHVGERPWWPIQCLNKEESERLRGERERSIFWRSISRDTNVEVSALSPSLSLINHLTSLPQNGLMRFPSFPLTHSISCTGRAIDVIFTARCFWSSLKTSLDLTSRDCAHLPFYKGMLNRALFLGPSTDSKAFL